MSCASTCELVQFKVESVRLLHISPRPGSGSPADLEERLIEMIKGDLERETHSCTDECDCVIGDPVQVQSRDQIKQVTDGTYTAWYRVTLSKYRTAGECMPKSDDLPEDARKSF